MKIPQKSRYTNGFYMNGTGSTRDQIRHIIYINIDKGNGEPSIYMFSHLPFHPLTLTISLPFPLTLPHHIPNIPFHFPHFSSPFNPFPIFPTLAAHSVYPLSFPILPLHPSYNRVQSIYTDLTPSATRFPTPTHTCPCTHVVRSCIHTLTLSYSLIMFHTVLCST